MPKINEFTKEDLLKKAEETLFPDGAVDLVRLANELEIEVYEIDLPEGLSGAATLVEENKYAIYVSDEDPQRRQRFSIAHELAHCVLHSDKLKASGELHRSQINKSPEEKEANQLAERIIMPDSLANKYLEDLGVNNGTLIDKNIIKKIADKFKVSEVVAIIRLRSLNYNVPYIYYA